MNAIKITPAQLTTAQLKGEVTLSTGENLCAMSLQDGTWKYILSWGGQVGQVVYAPAGLDAAVYALNVDFAY